MGFLEGKTAIITGGGRAVLKDGSCGSIGYGIATAYAKEGANLVITGRNVQKLEDAKEELERLYGIKVLPVQADVSADNDNKATVQKVIDQAIAEFGRIDVLINNAQASASGVSLAEHTTDQFDLAIYSGLYAAFYYMQACYPYLKEKPYLLPVAWINRILKYGKETAGGSADNNAAQSIKIGNGRVALLKEYGPLPLVYAGGVMSNSLLRKELTARYGGAFAPPAFSADNAAGVAFLCALADEAI